MLAETQKLIKNWGKIHFLNNIYNCCKKESRKCVETLKKMILTSKWRANHPFAGQNKHHLDSF